MTTQMYSITRTEPTVFIDPKTNKAVNGYNVYFNIAAYNESHQIQVTSLDKKTVADAINAVVSQRNDLATLGS